LKHTILRFADSVLQEVNRMRRRQPAASNGAGRFSGRVERVEYRTIFGWARDAAGPDRPVFLGFQVNGEDAGIRAADLYRTDIGVQQSAGGTLSGFEFTVPERFSEIHSIRVFVLETGEDLPHSSGAPINKRTNRPLPPEWKPASGLSFPSFFLLGAGKAGTTSLHGYLNQHPEICMAEPKEPIYFEAEFSRGPAYYFNRYFSHWAGEPIVGESRTRNLYLPYVPQRLFDYNPNAKLLAILRNPVERAISHWWHWYSRGEESLPLAGAIAADFKRIEAGYRYETATEMDVHQRSLELRSYALSTKHWLARKLALSPAPGQGLFRTYVDTGYYYDQLSRYLALFPRDSLKVVLFEDMVRSPEAVVLEICDFLGANRKLAGGISFGVLNRSDPEMANHLDRNVISQLVEHYRPYNRNLEELIGRSLESWDRPFAHKQPDQPERKITA
jgi:hypothetical protein